MRVCVVGCGEHATGSHGPALVRYARERAEVELTACCDLDPGRAARYRERFAFKRHYTDAAAMIEAERPDAALVAVLPEVMSGVAGAVLLRGVPALIEKPPGRTADEVDRLAALSEPAGRAPVPHQVGFNRRFVPLVREAVSRLAVIGPVRHVHYEMTRFDRREPDFSTTAIHGLDTVRFLSGSDYAEARFRYQEFPELGPGVAHMFVDAVMASGATAQLAFCPVGGDIVERATVHAEGHTLFTWLPVAGSSDLPGRLKHVERGRVVADLIGPPGGPDAEPFVLAGFLAQDAAFLDALARGATPSPGLRDSRQSVAVADCLRRREKEFHASTAREDLAR
jgi:myo-inositol 2-dehydrogenase / D-chiro-inositol 1-dehydrogenase